MATEKYGIYGELIQSLAATPVSTETKIIFIGACASGDLNKAHEIASFADYSTRLGGAVGDGYNLTEAAIAAFNVVGLGGVVMIPVSHSTTFSASDYVGDGVSTGAAAIVRYLAANPTAVVLVCAPSITNATALAAVKAACKKADGHWDSVLVYDTDVPADSVDANGIFVDSIFVEKTITDEQAICCLGKCKTDGAAVISMAAVRCCLMARADAGYGVPARSGGNLAIQGMSAWGMIGDVSKDRTFDGCTGELYSGNSYYVKDADGEYLSFGLDIDGATGSSPEYPGATVAKVQNAGGNTLWVITPANSGAITGNFSFVVSYTEKGFIPVDIPEARSTELSANGICAIVNYSGTFYTWGDHTSAFSNGAVSDERARFDNTIRMQNLITNRFQIKYRTSVDAPMTLQMRDDVINEELDFLASLVAIGALIGEPVCEFSPLDNPVDGVAQGQFVWKIADTPTIPFKFGNLKVAYTQAGLSVYMQ
jgi:hypothetical protein